MLMKSPFNTDCTLSLTDGRCISVSTEGSDVPMEFFQAAVEAKCIPVEDDGKKKQKNTEKTNAELLRDVLISMIESDNKEEFRDDGLPLLDAVISKLGRNIDDAELMAGWTALQNEAEKEDLIKEAKALKIKSPHLMSIETLKEKIAEAKG